MSDYNRQARRQRIRKTTLIVGVDIDNAFDAVGLMNKEGTVFVESEVVSLIAKGTEVKEIVAGLNRAVASRVVSLVKRIATDFNGLKVAMSGSVARNHGVVRALNLALKTEISVPQQPDTVGALGAALFARDRMLIS